MLPLRVLAKLELGLLGYGTTRWEAFGWSGTQNEGWGIYYSWWKLCVLKSYHARATIIIDNLISVNDTSN